MEKTKESRAKWIGHTRIMSKNKRITTIIGKKRSSGK